MSGPLKRLVDRGVPVSQRIVTQLAKTLDVSLEDDVASVVSAYEQHRSSNRFAGRGRGRRARRALLREVSQKWPELGDEERWEKSPLLKAEHQEELLAELKKLPSWENYETRLRQTEAANDESERHELRTVKYRRLISALEVVVLEQNLPLVATPAIVQRYQQLLALEETSLVSGKSSN